MFWHFLFVLPCNLHLSLVVLVALLCACVRACVRACVCVCVCVRACVMETTEEKQNLNILEAGMSVALKKSCFLIFKPEHLFYEVLTDDLSRFTICYSLRFTRLLAI